MTGDDLTSFMRSIAMHSQTLAQVFNKAVENMSIDMGEAACADDFAELMALAGAPASVPAPPPVISVSQGPATSSWAAVNSVPAAPALHAFVAAANPPSSKFFVAHTRKTKTSSPSDEEIRNFDRRPYSQDHRCVPCIFVDIPRKVNQVLGRLLTK
jgi:hypothetical protein